MDRADRTRRATAGRRRRVWRVGCVFALLFALAGTAFAVDFPLEGVAPGLEGYALTAGAGNRIERFPISVLGLQYDPAGGFPLVLVRAGGPFIEAAGGVAAGMSGSPVYLQRGGQDALLGAIGYVFPEADHSLALVTPISAMRGALPVVDAARPAPFGPTLAELGPATSVATPLLLSGLGPRAAGLLEPLFERSPVRLVPAQASGVSPAADEGYRLAPGSAISVQLARGDVTVAAVGTVTTFDDGRVLAFGHPLLGEGAVSFALAPAFVTTIVPSAVVPFKLANSGRRTLGAITEDRPAAIGGVLDVDPEMLPVTLTLNGPDGTHTKRFEVTRDERYYPVLIATAVLQLLDQAQAETGGGTADLAWEIELQRGDTVRVLEQAADETDLALAAARLAGAPLAILADNAFEAAEVDRVAINLDYDGELRLAEIVEVRAERDTLAPGEALVAFVRLQPYRQQAEVKTLTVPLPEDAEGQVRLTIRGGLETGGDGEDDTDADEPILSFGELLVALRENVQASEVVVETLVDGERERLERLPLPYLVRGEKTLTVTVETGDADEASPDEEPPSDVDEPSPPTDDPLPTPPGSPAPVEPGAAGSR